jgi:hypothetical protein
LASTTFIPVGELVAMLRSWCEEWDEWIAARDATPLNHAYRRTLNKENAQSQSAAMKRKQRKQSSPSSNDTQRERSLRNGLRVGPGFADPGKPKLGMPEGDTSDPERRLLLETLHNEMEALASVGVLSFSVENLPEERRIISGHDLTPSQHLKKRRIDVVMRMFTGDITPYLSAPMGLPGSPNFRWQGHSMLKSYTNDDLKKLLWLVQHKADAKTGGRN